MTHDSRTQPRLSPLRGGWAVVYWEGDKRRRYSLGTDDREEALRRLATWRPPQPRQKRVMRKSVVYFIRSECQTGFIKIGRASHAETRLSLLQVSTPYDLTLLATMPGGREEECALHKRFADLHVRGEWFRPSAELLAFIAQLPEEPKPVEPLSTIDYDKLLSIEEMHDMLDRMHEMDGTTPPIRIPFAPSGQ